MTPADPVLRPATEADVPLLLALIRELADYERMADQVAASEADLLGALFGSGRVADAVVAWVDGQAAGYAVWFPIFSTFQGRRGIYLEDLFVRPAFRGRGIGRALLAHVARAARTGGGTRVEWSVLDWNAPAAAFYRGLGAAPVEDWRVYRLSGDALSALAERSRPPASS